MNFPERSGESLGEDYRGSEAMIPCQPATSSRRRRRWAEAEGHPLPLGATWIEEEQAFNFAVYAEHAESVTL